MNVIKKNNPLNKDTKYDNNNVGVFAGTSVDVDEANKNQIGDDSYQPLMKEIANQAVKKVANAVAGGAGMIMSTKTEEQKSSTKVTGETKSSQDGEGMSESTGEVDSEKTFETTAEGISEQAPVANGSESTNKQVTVTGTGKTERAATVKAQKKSTELLGSDYESKFILFTNYHKNNIS